MDDSPSLAPARELQAAPMVTGAPAARLPLDPEARKVAYRLHFTVNQAVRNSFAVPIIMAFCALITWNDPSFNLGVVWALVVIAIYVARALLLRPGMDLSAIESAPALWARRLDLATGAAGLAVACGPAFLFPAFTDWSRMFLSMLLLSWLAGSMASLGARPALFRLYILLFIGGIAAGWARSDSEGVGEVLLLLLVFALIAATFAARFAVQVASGIDIRFENERLLAELSQAKAAAEESSAAKSRFLAVASHDLRQPLHALTMLNGMLGNARTPERVRELSVQMERASQTLDHLFTSLLDFSRLESGRTTVDIGPFSLAALLRRLEGEYRPRAEAKGLSLVFDGGEVHLESDGQIVERIVRNLLDNAIKFTASGSVQVRAATAGDRFSISVTDTGPGIPERLREAVFKEYFQVETSAAQAGLGLGLAIVRRLAGLIGADLSLTPMRPHGSCFALGFPRNVLCAPPALGAALGAAPPQVSLDGLRVVCIDDDPQVRDAMVTLLAEWKCDAIVAGSLSDALALLADRAPPQAILCDLSLGRGTSGVDVIAALRARFGPLPAAIVTGEAGVEARPDLAQADYPVLMKPVPVPELRGVLESFRGGT
ncbi:MAG: hybrid sensor histidine kinase/response regulator [Burkholderiales bacterium]|nr:hybrid sensor histidine kinase/response regulator [Burkholderiales bacterium]